MPGITTQICFHDHRRIGLEWSDGSLKAFGSMTLVFTVTIMKDETVDIILFKNDLQF